MRKDCDVKFDCHCGAAIVDQTDDLPHKAHLIPDQAWFATYDAIDAEVIEPAADGRLSKEAAHQHARRILNRSAKLVWQCRACGRLYVDDTEGRLRSFVPEGNSADRGVLRGK